MKTLLRAALGAVAALLLLLLGAADAHNTICMSANTIITKAYIDGVQVTDSLRHRTNANQCDCFSIPPNASVIAIRAECNQFQINKPGILECETDPHAVHTDWVCAPSSLVKKSWYMPDYPLGNELVWQPADETHCQHHCRRQKHLPCHTSKCVWTTHKATSVSCIKKKCADGCKGCAKNGPGQCDPGMCMYGESVNAVTGKTACDRTCKLEVHAWNTTGTGYIKLTDTVTGSISEWNANMAGAYLTTVDVSSCTLTNQNYFAWANAKPAEANLLQAFLYNQTLINQVAVEVGVGSGDTNSFAPWIQLYECGNGTPGTVGGIANPDQIMSYTAMLTGVTNGKVTISSVSMS